MTQTLPLPVTVYSKPDCVQCTAVKRYLKQHEITYVEHDVTESQEAYDKAFTFGITQMPIVVVPFDQGPDVVFGGFNPLKLAEIQR